MAMTITRTMTVRPTRDVRDVARLSSAIAIVVCLSSAPFVALSRWIARVPLAPESWPYRLSYWGAATLGLVMFVVDVLIPAFERRRERLRASTPALALAAALAAWALLSNIWTDSPDRTREHALLMALVVATAIWFGFALTFRQQVLALFVGLQSLTFVSVAAAVMLPSARLAEDDTWMGLFGNPNSLSPIAGLAIVAAVGVLVLSNHDTAVAGVAVCVVVDLLAAWKADSATGWIALGGAGVAGALVMITRQLVVVRRLAVDDPPMRRLRVAGMTLVGLAIVTIPWSIRAVARLVGKDGTLSGRTAIWDYVRDRTSDRWFAGYGFMSFWDTEANRLELGERRSFNTIPDTAHSTFFETLVFLGVVGVVLLVAIVAFSLGRTWWSAFTAPGPVTAWWAAVVTFMLLENVTESMITYHSVFWMLLIAPAFARIGVAYRTTSPSDDTPTQLERV